MRGTKLGYLPGLIVDSHPLRYVVFVAWDSSFQEEFHMEASIHYYSFKET